MGEVKTAEVVAILREQNPTKKDAELYIYATAFLEHAEAQANIDEHGTIVMHPRTGSPVDNPYTVVRDRAAKMLLSLALKTGGLWQKSKLLSKK